MYNLYRKADTDEQKGPRSSTKKYVALGVLAVIATLAVIGTQQTNLFKGALFLNNDAQKTYSVSSSYINTAACDAITLGSGQKINPNIIIGLQNISIDLDEMKIAYKLTEPLEMLSKKESQFRNAFTNLPPAALTQTTAAVNVASYTTVITAITADATITITERNNVLNEILKFSTDERIKLIGSLQSINTTSFTEQQLGLHEDSIKYLEKALTAKEFAILINDASNSVQKTLFIEKVNEYNASLADTDPEKVKLTTLIGELTPIYNETNFINALISLNANTYSRIAQVIYDYPVPTQVGYSTDPANNKDCAVAFSSTVGIDTTAYNKKTDSNPRLKVEFKNTSTPPVVIATQEIELNDEKHLAQIGWSGYCPSTGGGSAKCSPQTLNYTLTVTNLDTADVTLINENISLGETEVAPSFTYNGGNLTGAFSDTTSSGSNPENTPLENFVNNFVQNIFSNPKSYSSSLKEVFRLGDSFNLSIKNNPGFGKVNTPLYIKYKIVEKASSETLSQATTLLESDVITTIDPAQTNPTEIINWNKLCRSDSTPCIPSTGKNLYVVVQVTNSNLEQIVTDFLGYSSFQVFNDYMNSDSAAEAIEQQQEQCLTTETCDETNLFGFDLKYTTGAMYLLTEVFTGLLTDQTYTYIFPLQIAKPVIGLPAPQTLTPGSDLTLALNESTNTYIGPAKVTLNSNPTGCVINGNIANNQFVSTNSISTSCVSTPSAGSGNFTISHTMQDTINDAYKPLPVAFSMTVNGPSATPTLLTPANNATGVSRTPAFTWQHTTGATSYSLYISTTAAGLESATPVTLTTTSYTPTTQLAASTQYYWTVAAINGGVSTSYAPFSFTTAAAAETDTTPPQIVETWPKTTVRFASTFMSVKTNEAATCKFSTTSATFDFATSGTAMSPWPSEFGGFYYNDYTLTGLTNGTKTYYVKCSDAVDNVTPTATTITFTVDLTVATTGSVTVDADDLVQRGADADIKIQLGDADYIAVIANVVGPNNYAKTINFYCHTSYTSNCPEKKSTKLEGPTTLDWTWDTTGVAPGKYEVRVSARVTNSEVYRDDDEEIEVLVGSAGNCEDYFDDMKSNSPLCREVSFLRDRGIFMGQEVNGKRVANLNGNLIRSEYFAVATRLYGRTGSSVNYNDLLRFRDMSPSVISNPSNSWWVEAVLQLDGIVKGYGDGTLRPTQNITMAELGKVTSLATGFVRFYDDTRSPWYADIMNAYANVGVNFNPESRARRGDAVKLIYDTIQTVEGNYYR